MTRPVLKAHPSHPKRASLTPNSEAPPLFTGGSRAQHGPPGRGQRLGSSVFGRAAARFLRLGRLVDATVELRHSRRDPRR